MAGAFYVRSKRQEPEESSFWETIAPYLAAAPIVAAGTIGGALLGGPIGGA